MSVTRIDIPEVIVPGQRCGRHIRHDDESWNYQAEQATTLRTVAHTRHVGPFDQGNLGSCTGNALTGALMTDPIAVSTRVFDEGIARLVYSLATRLDSATGYWPPTDTGSSGLAVCTAAKNAGLISKYTHTFSLSAALGALVLSPVLLGCNWYDSFDSGDTNGDGSGIIAVTPDASVRGGHEIELHAINVEKKLVGFYNSWGTSWGVLGGKAMMSWDTLSRLLSEQGDVTCPVK